MDRGRYLRLDNSLFMSFSCRLCRQNTRCCSFSLQLAMEEAHGRQVSVGMGREIKWVITWSSRWSLRMEYRCSVKRCLVWRPHQEHGMP